MSSTVTAIADHSRPAHVRENYGVLAAAEKRALVWMATRLPRWVTSDQLTALGGLATLGTALSFWGAHLSPASLLLVPVCLAINWFGDSLDGTLARVRQQQRPRYGYYVDHVVDILGATALMAGLAGSGLIHPWVAVGLLVCSLLLCAETFLATLSLGVFRMSFSGVGPTELRLLLAAGALRASVDPTVSLFDLEVRLFDLGGVIGIAGMSVALLVSAVRNGAELARQEPKGMQGSVGFRRP